MLPPCNSHTVRYTRTGFAPPRFAPPREGVPEPEPPPLRALACKDGIREGFGAAKTLPPPVPCCCPPWVLGAPCWPWPLYEGRVATPVDVIIRSRGRAAVRGFDLPGGAAALGAPAAAAGVTTTTLPLVVACGYGHMRPDSSCAHGGSIERDDA